jgi:hypothetical protein
VNVRLARLVDEAIVWIVVSFLLFGLVGLLLGWLNMVTTSPIELAPAFSAKQRTAAIRDIEAQRELLTRQAEGSLRSFYRQQWNIVEKLTPRVDNWHLDAICDHLSATVAPPGERPAINKLVINVPPRNSKSTTSCVAFPAWVWGPRNLPGKRFIFVTYRLSLARRDSRYTRNVITSPWYQAAWGDRFSLVRDQKTKDRYDNDKTGYRMIGSFRGGVMGEGANYLVIDDPLDATSLASPTELEHVIEIWKTGLVTRLNHQEQDVRIIIMQRLHENDLCGHVLKEDGWTHLRLPAAFEVEDRCRTFVEVQGTKQLFFEDPRTEDGEPLNPKRFPAADLERMRVEDEWVFAAQQQQRPAPRGGQILQKARRRRRQAAEAGPRRAVVGPGVQGSQDLRLCRGARRRAVRRRHLPDRLPARARGLQRHVRPDAAVALAAFAPGGEAGRGQGERPRGRGCAEARSPRDRARRTRGREDCARLRGPTHAQGRERLPAESGGSDHREADPRACLGAVVHQELRGLPEGPPR